MSSGKAPLLDERETSSTSSDAGKRAPPSANNVVDGVDTPTTPRSTKKTHTLRETSALDLAERCSERLGLIHAVCESARFARKVDRRTRRLLYIDQLSQFVASSQAIPVAVGLVFGRTLSNNVDSFVSAFVSPLLAALGGKTHLSSMSFTINEAVFAYGAFLQSVIQTAFTVVALFYLVVIPMSTFTSLKYVHHVLCPECQSWIKENARRCPMCGQLTGLSAVEVIGGMNNNALEGGGGGGGGRAGGSHNHNHAHAHADDDDDDDSADDPNDTERQHGGASKSRMRGFGKLWGSASR